MHRTPLERLGSSSISNARLPAKKRRVLVVDDSSTIGKIIQLSLHQANLNVGDILEASNGREAFGMVQRFTFELSLPGIDLPLMDGRELLERLTDVRRAPGSPVAVITRRTAEGGVLCAMGAGGKAYIRKPFTAYREAGTSQKLMPGTIRGGAGEGARLATFSQQYH